MLRDAHVRRGLSGLVALTCLLPVGIFLLVLRESIDAWVQIGPAAFFFDARWSPGGSEWLVLQMLATTVVSTAGAVLLTTPVALGLCLHLHWFARPSSASLSRIGLGVLAGTPSVVFGLVALFTVVPLIRAVHPPGLSLLATILVLAAMILPTLSLGIDTALQSVPTSQIQAAAALGLGPFDTTRAVLLPSARRGIRTAVVVASTRALGETMAVLMVAGNTVAWPDSLFQPVRTMTGGIAVEMAYAADLHRSALFVSATLLLGLVAMLLGLRR